MKISTRTSVVYDFKPAFQDAEVNIDVGFRAFGGISLGLSNGGRLTINPEEARFVADLLNEAAGVSEKNSETQEY